MEDNFRCNVLIMGKTGTGKSTLLNYLCDEVKAQAGTGKPVTGEGIYDYTTVINGQEVQIYDSWGIEAGKVDRWMHLLDDSLKSHGVDKNIEDWFHSVIYCIQAGGGRVENIDAEIIRRFVSDGYLVTVVLTKADQVEDVDIEKMKSVISGSLNGMRCSGNKPLNIISTCAEKKVTRAGETKPFGREDLQRAILDGWKDTVVERIPKHVISRLCDYVDQWKSSEINSLLSSSVSGLSENNVAIYEGINKRAEELRKEISDCKMNEFFKKAVDSCRRADSTLRATFDIQLDSFNNAQKIEAEMRWYDYLYAIPIGIAVIIPMMITDFFQARSEKNIQKQAENIEHHIEAIAEHIKSQCRKYEPILAAELKVKL